MESKNNKYNTQRFQSNTDYNKNEQLDDKVSNFTSNTVSGPPTFKVVVLGDKNVGKTSLIKRCIENVFNDNEDASMGA